MRISDMLISIAQWLESPNNEAVLLAEYDDECLKVVADSCVSAASLLKKAAQQVEVLEPPTESQITPESLNELALIADAFDSSGDPNLKKQASVIDELLLTIAAPQGFITNKKAAEDDRIDALRKAYQNPSKEQAEEVKSADSIKAIKDSGMTKEQPIHQQSLSTRYDPEHPGVLVSRVGDGEWQSEMTKRIFNYNEGFKLNSGDVVPGGSVADQTGVDHREYHTSFDTREGRLGQ